MAHANRVRKNRLPNNLSMTLSFEHTEQLGVQVFSLSGRLMEKRQAETLVAAIEDACNNGKIKIVLGLSNLEYMNSTGLNTVLSLLTITRNSGGELVIGSVSEKVRELLIMTKLNSVFSIHENINTACEAVSER
jgi:anti-sigma B factor antagonist